MVATLEAELFLREAPRLTQLSDNLAEERLGRRPYRTFRSSAAHPVTIFAGRRL